MTKTQIRNGSRHNVQYAVLFPAIAEKRQGRLGTRDTRHGQEESGSRTQHVPMLVLPGGA